MTDHWIETHQGSKCTFSFRLQLIRDHGTDRAHRNCGGDEVIVMD